MLSFALMVVVVGANALLAVFVLTNNPHKLLNRILGTLSIAIGCWSVVTFFEDTGLPQRVVDNLVMADFLLSAVMVGLFFWFCYELTRMSWKWLLWLGVVGWLANSILIISGGIIRVMIEPHHVAFIDQTAYPVFLSYVAYGLLGGLIILAARHRQSKSRERSQIEFIFYGLFLTAVTIIITNVILPNYIQTPPAVTRIGIYSTLFLTGLMTYAIVRHRFMNVRFVVARSVAYTLLLVSLAGLYGAVIFSISQYLFPGSTVSLAQNAVYVVLAVLLAFTFQPLKHFFEQLTDRIFFRDRYDTQTVLNRLGQILVDEFKLEGLLQRTLTDLCEQLNIQSGQLYVFDAGRVYKLEHYGPLPHKVMTVAHLEELRRNVLIADELEPGKAQDTLNDHGIRVVMKLRTREEFVGYLLLGDKLSGDLYTSQDIELLEIFIQELAVAVSNAKAYEEIAHFNVTLQGKVDDATARLQTANRHLKELDKAKDEFISMASHQLRTPITGIKGYLSLLLDGDAGTITAQQREFIGSAFDGSQRMINMVSDLLNVSRMSAGRFVIDRSPVDLYALVQGEVHQLQRTAEAKHLKLVFTSPKRKLPVMQLDEDKTRQVVMNFIDNAIYYTPKGKVTVSLERVGKHAELRVKDSGIGVPEAARSHLFSKYYRADNAKGVRPDGTGLGLFLAKRVVEDQGGSIIFESVEGEGSTFGFTMPLK